MGLLSLTFGSQGGGEGVAAAAVAYNSNNTLVV